MPLLCGSGKLHLPVRGGDNDAVLMQTGWHRIGVHDTLDRLDIRALGARLVHIGRSRVFRTPVDGLCIRMDPEIPSVSALGILLANRLSRILVQELANHRLCNRVNDSRIRSAFSSGSGSHSSHPARGHEGLGLWRLSH